MGHECEAVGGGAGRGGGAPSWAARLSAAGSPVCTPDWLALREPADAAARADDLADRLRAHLADRGRTGSRGVVVRDLGCGAGSMGRWLAPRLPGPQRWLLHDRDPGLVRRAAGSLPVVGGDGAPVTAAGVVGDLTALDGATLTGTAVVVCSALLDLLTADEVGSLAAACGSARAAALLTLSVAGAVTITPADPRDVAFAAAFDDHQRRTVDGRRLLGPDAGCEAAEAFARRGATVHRRETPWCLAAGDGGPTDALIEEWLRGWVEAACAQEPALADEASDYLARRLGEIRAGTVRVEVGHTDVLVLPGVGG